MKKKLVHLFYCVAILSLLPLGLQAGMQRIDLNIVGESDAVDSETTNSGSNPIDEIVNPPPSTPSLDRVRGPILGKPEILTAQRKNWKGQPWIGCVGQVQIGYLKTEADQAAAKEKHNVDERALEQLTELSLLTKEAKAAKEKGDRATFATKAKAAQASIKRLKEICRHQDIKGVQYVDKVFAKHLNDNALKCAQQGVRKVNSSQSTLRLPIPSGVYLNTNKIYSDRKVLKNGVAQSRTSRHAFGRAIDIYDITLRFPNPQDEPEVMGTTVDDYRRARNGIFVEKIFFDEFRKCWAENMPKTCGDWGGSIGHVHSEGYTRSDHNNHLHLDICTQAK